MNLEEWILVCVCVCVCVCAGRPTDLAKDQSAICGVL